MIRFRFFDFLHQFEILALGDLSPSPKFYHLAILHCELVGEGEKKVGLSEIPKRV